MRWVPSRVTLERFRMRRRVISGTAIV